jgi:hypothetical protein
MAPNETRWQALAVSVGDDDTKLNAALMAAMTAYQQRWGFLPGGYDYAEANDLYGLALDAYAEAGGLAVLVELP